MARMEEETYKISISRLFKNDEPSPDHFLQADHVAQLEAVVQELVGDNKAMIEVERVDE